MFGLGGPEAGFLVLVPLLSWALVLLALYWVVRLAVRHGLRDAHRHQLPHAPGAADGSAPPTGGV